MPGMIVKHYRRSPSLIYSNLVRGPLCTTQDRLPTLFRLLSSPVLKLYRELITTHLAHNAVLHSSMFAVAADSKQLKHPVSLLCIPAEMPHRLDTGLTDVHLMKAECYPFGPKLSPKAPTPGRLSMAWSRSGES